MCACFGVYIHPEELDEIWIDEASSAGIGLVAFHPAGGENTADSFERFLHLTEEPGFQSLMEKMRQKGILAETAAHALSWLLPREEFEAHPDWFRMDETGNRVKAFNCCPSSLAAMAYLEDRAAALVGKIPGLLHLEVRRAFNGMDYALYSEFESREALANYAQHPLHLAAKEKFHHFLEKRYCADYEY